MREKVKGKVKVKLKGKGKVVFCPELMFKN